jgi:hypothetical protein
MQRAMAMVVMLSTCASGCRRDSQKGDAPPPVASVSASVCSGGGGKIGDAIASKLMPTSVEPYCVDPNTETRTYGKDAKGTIEQVCTELFDGECEVYRNYGLERVVSVRYADGSGTPGTVTVNLSRFDSSTNAFGFFTKRLLGDSDPETLSTELIDAGTMAAAGSGVAYLVRGAHVAELSYSNDNEAPDALKASAKKILPRLSKAIGDLLPGELELPLAAKMLPEKERLRLGIQFESKDILGISGVGPGAVGFYKDGGKRYRIVTMERPNDQSAQDVMKTLKRAEGASESKGPPPILSLSMRAGGDGSKVEWIFGRNGRAVIGIGDDEHRLGDRLTTVEKQSKLSAAMSDIGKRLPAAVGP